MNSHEDFFVSGTVSTRWYFTDWMSDESVRACSLGARGLWMDLLCIAGSNKDKEHGFVLIGGKVPTIEYLARRLGSTSEEMKKLLEELSDNRVFNRDKRGAIYCRRMVRAEKYRGNGRLGGVAKPIKGKGNKKAPPTPVPEPEPEPLESKTAASPKAAKRAKPRTRIPDRAVLVEGPNMEFAVAHGFPPAGAVAMFEEFRDYHIGKGNQMADWAAAWRTWVRNQIKFKGGPNGRGPNGSEAARSGGGKVGFSGLAARVRRGIEERQHAGASAFDFQAPSRESKD